MSAARARAVRQIDVHVTYGLGGSCRGRFPRAEVEGVSALAMIGRVVQHPQPSGEPAHTAAVLAEVLRSRHELDAEVIDPARAEDDGTPIALDQPLLRAREEAGSGRTGSMADQDEVAIRISESYRGGA